jgi:hypothetical protein
MFIVCLYVINFNKKLLFATKVRVSVIESYTRFKGLAFVPVEGYLHVLVWCSFLSFEELQ